MTPSQSYPDLARFNPPSASSAEGTSAAHSWASNSTRFQPTLRLIGGGNMHATATKRRSSMFQPTLRLIGGGNRSDVGPSARSRVSTHPPPHRRREHLAGGVRCGPGRVSTHPPPHRRREPIRIVITTAGEVSTHPPPHRRRERDSGRGIRSLPLFQPTLRLIGGGNQTGPVDPLVILVSTHPPPHRRREHE